jgi:hypothetical protein
MFTLPTCLNKKYITYGAIVAVILFLIIAFLFITFLFIRSDDEESEFADLLELANSKL